MFSVLMTFIFIAAGVFLFVRSGALVARFVNHRGDPTIPSFVPKILGSVLVFMGLAIGAGTSYVHIPSNSVGLIRKHYGASLPEGRVVATNGEAGPQANMLMPGFHFSPFLNVINTIDVHPMVHIPVGFYGSITARDGRHLPMGDILAPEWREDLTIEMLKPDVFLRGDRARSIEPGFRGAQLSVLRPGTYPINLHLFTIVVAGTGEKNTYTYRAIPGGANGPEVTTDRGNTLLTKVPAGHVAVIRSSVQTANNSCPKAETATLVVPRGCRGIWREVLAPGDYYLNHDAYSVTLMDVRLQSWDYQGGYIKRIVDLTVSADGSIQQRAREVNFEYDPKIHADRAIMVKVEGWDIPHELRVVVEVSPQNTPTVVANVGDIKQVEDRVVTPLVRSVLRNVIGGGTITVVEDGKEVRRQVRVLDLIENRDAIERAVEEIVRPEALQHGISIREIRLGEPAIPPELLLARQREQLAGQLVRSFEEERKAQLQRQATEQARATAAQQESVVREQIAASNALLAEQRRQAEGRGERKYMEELAKGQEAVANVLGRESTVQFRIVEMILAAIREKPELVTGIRLPNVFTVTNGGGATDALASGVLGQALQQLNTAAPRPPAPQR